MVESFVLMCLMYGHQPHLDQSTLTCRPPPGVYKVRPVATMRHPACSAFERGSVRAIEEFLSELKPKEGP